MTFESKDSEFKVIYSTEQPKMKLKNATNNKFEEFSRQLL